MKRAFALAAAAALAIVVCSLVVAGCGSGDVTVRGRMVDKGDGVEGLLVVLADFEESDGMSGFSLRFTETGTPENPWAETDANGVFQITVPADQAKELGPTVLVVADREQGLIERRLLTEGFTGLVDESGDPLRWDKGRLRGTVDVGDIEVSTD